MPMFVRCARCSGILGISTAKIDKQGDPCLVVGPCPGCLEKARQEGIGSVEMSVREPEATTDDTDDTDEPLSAKQVRRELCAVEGRLARLIRDVHTRLKVAEDTLADAEDDRD